MRLGLAVFFLNIKTIISLTYPHFGHAAVAVRGLSESDELAITHRLSAFALFSKELPNGEQGDNDDDPEQKGLLGLLHF